MKANIDGDFVLLQQCRIKVILLEMNRRNTTTKEAVLSVLNSSGKAMSQGAIEKEVGVDINRATIYRILNRFCDDGVLHKIVADDGKQYFAVCMNCDEKETSTHHFHFRCNRCETIECLPIPVHFALPGAYEVEGINCVITGKCKDCA